LAVGRVEMEEMNFDAEEVEYIPPSGKVVELIERVITQNDKILELLSEWGQPITILTPRKEQ
jgi:hypothetical protein